MSAQPLSQNISEPESHFDAIARYHHAPQSPLPCCCPWVWQKCAENKNILITSSCFKLLGVPGPDHLHLLLNLSPGSSPSSPSTSVQTCPDHWTTGSLEDLKSISAFSLARPVIQIPSLLFCKSNKYIWHNINVKHTHTRSISNKLLQLRSVV